MPDGVAIKGLLVMAVVWVIVLTAHSFTLHESIMAPAYYEIEYTPPYIEEVTP